MPKVAKRRRCKICNRLFTQFRSTQRTCSLRCALKDGKEKEAKKRAKKERAEMRKRKEDLKSLRDWMKDAQKEFNKFIRLDDASRS